MDSAKKKKRLKISRIIFWIFLTPVLIWAFYQQFYVSYPEIPTPPIRLETTEGFYAWQGLSPSTSPGDLKIVGEDGKEYEVNSTIGSDEVGFHGTTVVPMNADQPRYLTKVEEGEKKAKDLRVEIRQLEVRKKDLEENIKLLRKENNRLSNMSYDTQVAIIKFVEKNRIRDMIGSAFIGAFVSVILTFILGMPVVRDKIYNYFWEDNSR